LSRDMIVRVAVDVATPAIDRLYDYAVPEELQDVMSCGMRVSVPFGRGNRREEAMVLAISDRSEYGKCKQIDAVLDSAPVLSEELLKLAVHLRERLNCAAVRSCRTACFSVFFKKPLTNGKYCGIIKSNQLVTDE